MRHIKKVVLLGEMQRLSQLGRRVTKQGSWLGGWFGRLTSGGACSNPVVHTAEPNCARHPAGLRRKYSSQQKHYVSVSKSEWLTKC